MRRALTILKYVPAALWVLLVLVWPLSDSFDLGCRLPLVEVNRQPLSAALEFSRGNAIAWLHWKEDGPVVCAQHHQARDLSKLIPRSANEPIVVIPIEFGAVLLIPLAIGPFIRFRFPLWSYFAWTALVAAELTYYLR